MSLVTLIPLKIYVWGLLIKTINLRKNSYKLIKLNEKLLSIAVQGEDDAQKCQRWICLEQDTRTTGQEKDKCLAIWLNGKLGQVKHAREHNQDNNYYCHVCIFEPRPSRHQPTSPQNFGLPSVWHSSLQIWRSLCFSFLLSTDWQRVLIMAIWAGRLEF